MHLEISFRVSCHQRPNFDAQIRLDRRIDPAAAHFPDRQMYVHIEHALNALFPGLCQCMNLSGVELYHARDVVDRCQHLIHKTFM